jgi:hypothetical protein
VSVFICFSQRVRLVTVNVCSIYSVGPPPNDKLLGLLAIGFQNMISEPCLSKRSSVRIPGIPSCSVKLGVCSVSMSIIGSTCRNYVQNHLES